MPFLLGIAQCTPSSTTLTVWFSPFRLSSIANTPRSLLAPGKIQTLEFKAVLRIRTYSFDTVPDPFRVQGFDDQKLEKKIYS
jgi:hypothetical protein